MHFISQRTFISIILFDSPPSPVSRLMLYLIAVTETRKAEFLQLSSQVSEIPVSQSWKGLQGLSKPTGSEQEFPFNALDQKSPSLLLEHV